MWKWEASDRPRVDDASRIFHLPQPASSLCLGKLASSSSPLPSLPLEQQSHSVTQGQFQQGEKSPRAGACEVVKGYRPRLGFKEAH